MTLFALIVGVVAIVMLQRWLAEFRQLPIDNTKDLTKSLATAFDWCVGTASVTVVWFGLYLWRFGARVRAAMRFPPPDTRVIRDTVVLRGSPARRRAALIQALAAALLLSTLGLAAVAWRLHSLLAWRIH